MSVLSCWLAVVVCPCLDLLLHPLVVLLRDSGIGKDFGSDF